MAVHDVVSGGQCSVGALLSCTVLDLFFDRMRFYNERNSITI